jgi:hypothetical protein
VIAIEELLRLVLDELDESERDRVDEHLLGCSDCAATAEQLAVVGEEITALVRTASVSVVVTARARAELERAGLITRTYALRPGDIVPCTVDALDRYVLTELSAELAGVRRVDLVVGDRRLEDIPFDTEKGSVEYVSPGEVLRALPSMTLPLRLVAVDGASERDLGSYTLEHTAYAPP